MKTIVRCSLFLFSVLMILLSSSFTSYCIGIEHPPFPFEFNTNEYNYFISGKVDKSTDLVSIKIARLDRSTHYYIERGDDRDTFRSGNGEDFYIYNYDLKDGSWNPRLSYYDTSFICARDEWVSGFRNYSIIPMASNVSWLDENLNIYFTPPTSNVYTYSAGDVVLFDEPGNSVTIKASFDHAIEMKVRQYVDGEVTTSWFTQIADKTYVVPDGYLEFEFVSVSDGGDIEIEAFASPINLDNPTVTTKTMINGESSYNKLTIENRRSDNVQVNIHVEDGGLLEKPFTHIIYYDKVVQFEEEFWNATGETYLGETTGSMTVYLKPGQKVVVWNVRKTTRVKYLDKFNIIVTEELEEYNLGSGDLPYYAPGNFPYNPDYDSSGEVEPPPVNETTMFESIYWLYDTATNIISLFSDGIRSLWSGVGQMKNVMDDLFGFLPAEMRNLMYIGTLCGIVLRIFGR